MLAPQCTMIGSETRLTLKEKKIKIEHHVEGCKEESFVENQRKYEIRSIVQASFFITKHRTNLKIKIGMRKQQ